jgi:putative ABC transport system substrate-binding protein
VQRRSLVAALAAAYWATPSRLGAQPAGRIHRLGLLHPDAHGVSGGPNAPTFLTAPMRDLGYVEGRNLIVEKRYAHGKFDRLPGLARELVDVPVDVIVAVSTSAALAAKAATKMIPIVFLSNSDPVAAQIVPSLANSIGNVTGVVIAPGGSLADKRVELLKACVPRAERIALLWLDSPSAGPQLQANETRAAATALGLALDVVLVRDRDYAHAFAAIAALRPQVQALVVGASPAFLRDRKEIIELAAKHRLPAVYEWPRQVKEGGLMSYGANEVETYERVALYVDRIFKGAQPSDLPIWQPSKLHLVINLGTARALGLTIPQSMRLRADELVQ